MPGSTSAGRNEGLNFVFEHAPELESILDVGPGAGQWYDLLKPWYPEARWCAVEIFEPYVERYQLRKKYDTVWVADIRELAKALPHFDLAIFGDVLEHMSKEHAFEVVMALDFRHLLLSVPLGFCPQEPTEENPYEEHVATWETNEILALFPVVEAFVGADPIKHAGLDIRRGVFLLEKK